MINRIKNAFYVVDDVQRGHDMLVRLGLEPKFVDGRRWSELRAAGQTLAISSTDEGHVSPGSNAILTFEVDDLDAVIKVLRTDPDIDVCEQWSLGEHGRTVACTDWVGNRFQFWSPR